MRDDQFNNSDWEKEEAQRRIDRIRSGGAPQPSRADGLDDVDSGVVSPRSSRSRAARAALGMEDEQASRSRATTTRAGASGRGRQAMIMIGGLVAIGALVVVILYLVAQLAGGSGIKLPGFATDTPTPTVTPLPTETPTPTPTPEPPDLQVPGLLTCYYQSGISCYDYCRDPDNAAECSGAKDFVRAQGADPDVWLNCIAPGPGPNVGDPMECLIDAWYAANP